MIDAPTLNLVVVAALGAAVATCGILWLVEYATDRLAEKLREAGQ